MKSAKAFCRWLEEERYLNANIDREKVVQQDPPPAPVTHNNEPKGRRIYVRK